MLPDPLELPMGGGRDVWMAEAACRGQTDLFFLDRGESLAQAKAVCRECPVIAECQDYAVRNVERHGLWGGLSERERQRIRVQRRRGRVA